MAKKKDKGGRPTDYCEEILLKTREYIDNCEDEDIQKVKQSNEEKGYEMYENKLKVNLPTVAGLAVYLEVSRDTIYEWASKHKEFSDIIKRLRAKQEDRLINSGLSGDYNPTIAKVLLAKHGYKDSSESEVNIKSVSLTELFNGESK